MRDPESRELVQAVVQALVEAGLPILTRHENLAVVWRQAVQRLLESIVPLAAARGGTHRSSDPPQAAILSEVMGKALGGGQRRERRVDPRGCRRKGFPRACRGVLA